MNRRHEKLPGTAIVDWNDASGMAAAVVEWMDPPDVLESMLGSTEPDTPTGHRLPKKFSVVSDGFVGPAAWGGRMKVTSTPDWRVLSALYDEAQALDPAQRQAWLQKLEANDQPQWQPLARMLLEAEQLLAGDYLLAPPELDGLGAASGVEQGATLQAGVPIGPYRLLRPLGAGGMADVWLAERADGAFSRQLALKLLNGQFGSSRQLAFRQRFEREHRILATLRHPHIAALHDAGVTPQGQHWLALEFVDGLPMDQWCDARRLTTRQRVQLFGQVLHAVSHAHGRLVIHRDLKPSNILVTDEGEVRLLDFGIAALLEEGDSVADAGDLTRQTGRPLTPRYASPEQLKGLALGTATDVYSLGVMLHELLSGSWPYLPEGTTARALERAVLGTEPRAPSRCKPSAEILAARGCSAKAWQRQLEPDLDAVVLRAVARNTTQRYGSVDALAADLERWLAGEPVQARRPGWAQRARKFVWRHPVGTAATSLAGTALCVAAAVATVNAQEARSEAQRARSATQFVLRLFEDVDPDNHGGRTLTPLELLERRRLQLTGSAKGALATPAERALQVELLTGIARTQYQMGEHDAAEQSYSQALELMRDVHGDPGKAWALSWRAENDMRRGQLGAAKAGLTSSQRQLPDDRAPWALRAHRDEVQGWVAHSEGRWSDANASFDAALAALPVNAEAPHQALDLYMAKAQNDARRGNAAAAQAALDQVHALSKTVPALGTGKQLDVALISAVVWDRLAEHERVAQATPGDLARCEQVYSAQSETCRKLHLMLLRAWMRLGEWQTLWQRWPAVIRLIDGRTTAPARVVTLTLANRVAWLAGDGHAQQQVAQRLQAMASSNLSASVVLRARQALAEGELFAGQPRAALERLQAARMGATAAGGLKDEALDAQLLLLEGMVWQALGDSALALSHMARAELGFASAQGENHPLTVLWSLNQVAPLAELGRQQEALALLNKAQPMLERLLGKSSPTAQRLGLLRQALVPRGDARLGDRKPEGAKPARKWEAFY